MLSVILYTLYIYVIHTYISTFNTYHVEIHLGISIEYKNPIGYQIPIGPLILIIIGTPLIPDRRRVPYNHNLFKYYSIQYYLTTADTQPAQPRSHRKWKNYRRMLRVSIYARFFVIFIYLRGSWEIAGYLY